MTTAVDVLILLSAANIELQDISRPRPLAKAGTPSGRNRK